MTTLAQVFFSREFDVEWREKPEIEFKMNIKLKEEKVFFYKSRRFSCNEKNIIAELIDELLKNGILRQSNSKYESQVVLVKKKNSDEYRMCIDFRTLNKLMVRDVYPIPMIEDQIDQLSDKKYFSVLDWKNAFNQISFEENSIKYTSFMCHLGQYEYVKMPYGLVNGSSVFQWYICEIYKDLIR